MHDDIRLVLQASILTNLSQLTAEQELQVRNLQLLIDFFFLLSSLEHSLIDGSFKVYLK
jgi:hypothetical protein